MQTAAVLDNIFPPTASALDNQLQVNQLLLLGVLNLHNQVVLLQDDINHLWDLAQDNCDPHYPNICLKQYQTQLNSRAALSLQHSYRVDTWNSSFLSFISFIKIFFSLMLLM